MTVDKQHLTYTTTKLLMSCIIFMYLIQVYMKYKYGPESIIILGAKWNPGIINGEYWRFISYVFLHGNLIHLTLNLLFLYVFGREAEYIAGKQRYLIIYFFSAWGAGITSYIISPNISIGASGALFGIIGFLCVYYFKLGQFISSAYERYKTMYTLAAINIVISLFLPNIDNGAHIGGLISGILLGFIYAPNYVIEMIDDKKIIKPKIKKHTMYINTSALFIIFYILTRLIS